MDFKQVSAVKDQVNRIQDQFLTIQEQKMQDSLAYDNDSVNRIYDDV
jgi:hypothetical protein